MLLENKGLTIENFFIPPFTVDKGEILTIYMFSGAHFFPLEKKLGDILTGHTKSDNVKIYGQFQFIKNTQTFSDIPNIIFDLVGQDMHRALETFESVKQHVRNGGSAIFLDNFNDSTLDRTKHVEIRKLT